jgi:hypothetical protein
LPKTREICHSRTFFLCKNIRSFHFWAQEFIKSLSSSSFFNITSIFFSKTALRHRSISQIMYFKYFFLILHRVSTCWRFNSIYKIGVTSGVFFWKLSCKSRFFLFARKILSHVHDYLGKHISIISLLLHKVSPHYDWKRNTRINFQRWRFGDEHPLKCNLTKNSSK